MMRTDDQLSELVVAHALRNAPPDFLVDTQSTNDWAKIFCRIRLHAHREAEKMT